MVFKLMLPHCRYTMNVNSEARFSLINAEGVIETTFTPGTVCMEISSAVYGKQWRFETQDLEQDLISRNMVKADANGNPILTAEGCLEPVIEYPYAQDGLDLYCAMRKYFKKYLSLYYSDNGAAGYPKVTEDPELMAFWDEAREKGHPDKTDGWIELTDIASLARILTTIAWTASAHHSAVNFGQYDYSGWMPNKPSKIRKPIPTDEEGLKALKQDFERTMLSLISDALAALKVMFTVRILSLHMSDEVFLSDKNTLLKDPEAKKVEKEFQKKLEQVQKNIEARNAAGKSMVRSEGGPSLPYTLLMPARPEGYEPGDRPGRGVATSISI